MNQEEKQMNEIEIPQIEERKIDKKIVYIIGIIILVSLLLAGVAWSLLYEKVKLYKGLKYFLENQQSIVMEISDSGIIEQILYDESEIDYSINLGNMEAFEYTIGLDGRIARDYEARQMDIETMVSVMNYKLGEGTLSVNGNEASLKIPDLFQFEMKFHTDTIGKDFNQTMLSELSGIKLPNDLGIDLFAPKRESASSIWKKHWEEKSLLQNFKYLVKEAECEQNEYTVSLYADSINEYFEAEWFVENPIIRVVLDNNERLLEIDLVNPESLKENALSLEALSVRASEQDNLIYHIKGVQKINNLSNQLQRIPFQIAVKTDGNNIVIQSTLENGDTQFELEGEVCVEKLEPDCLHLRYVNTQLRKDNEIILQSSGNITIN